MQYAFVKRASKKRKIDRSLDRIVTSNVIEEKPPREATFTATQVEAMLKMVVKVLRAEGDEEGNERKESSPNCSYIS